MATIIAFNGKRPNIHPTAFVAPTAVLVGNVTVGPEASIWFGAVLRGERRRQPEADRQQQDVQTHRA